MSEQTIRNVVKYALKVKSKGTSLLKNSRPRVERSKKLLSILKKGQPIILFSDEKFFKVDSVSKF